MKSRAWGFAALREHIITAVHDYELYARKSHSHLKRSYPVAWIIGVIVVAVHRDIVGRNKVRIITTGISEFCAHMIVNNSCSHIICIADYKPVWIQIVLRIPGAICCIECEFHLLTSFSSLVK